MLRRACKENMNFTLQKSVAMPRRACKENMNFMWQEFMMPRRACKETTNFTLQKPVAMPRRACKENMNFTWQKSGPTENRDGSFQFIIRVECLVLWGNMIQTIVAGSAEKALRFQSAG